MPKRRDVLKAITAASVGAAEPAGKPSIYIPERHVEHDKGLILDFVEEYSFAMLVTAKGSAQITNAPTLIDRSVGEWGKLWWHIAKNNPQNDAFDGATDCVAVFHGPHGYISPNWYQTAAAVPTWNFAVVHMTGTPKRVDDDAAFARSLEQLVARNEGHYGGGERWAYSKLPDSYLKGMRQGIVAYEMTVQKVEAKFKLGQERTAADRAGVLAGLAKSPKPRTLIELTKAYYSRFK